MIPIPERVQQIPGRFSVAVQELVFQASNISPLSYQSYYVNLTSNEVDVVLADQPDDQFIHKDNQVYQNLPHNFFL